MVAKKSSPKSAAGHGAFQMPETSATRPNSAPANVNSVGSVDALLALQAVPDATGRRARAVKRAENMLDILEDLKLSVLSGRVPQAHLNRLIAVLNARRDALSDPQLIEIIDEIELRAKVELAKLGHIAA